MYKWDGDTFIRELNLDKDKSLLILVFEPEDLLSKLSQNV